VTVTLPARPSTGPGHVVRGAGAIGVSTALSGALGIAFWVVAARLHSPAQVGVDALLLAAVQAIAAASDLNLNMSLPRLLPQLGAQRARFVVAAYAAVAVAGTLGGAGFLVAASWYRPLSPYLGEGVFLPLVVVAGVVVIGIFALQDSVLIAVRRVAWVPVENTGFAVLKLALLVALHAAGVPHAILLAWLMAAVAATVPINVFVVPAALASFRSRTSLELGGVRPKRAALASFLAYDYGALLVQQAGVLFVPVLVAVTLGAAANGLFATCFTVVLAAETVLLGVASMLTVEAAADRDAAKDVVRRTVRRFGWVVPLGVGASVALAPLVLRVFGAAYVQTMSGTFRLLLIAIVPQAVIILRTALWRIDGRSRPIFWTQGAVVAATTIGLALTLRDHGMPAIGWTWLVANGSVALLLLPSLAAWLRKGGTR
jgi:O-antigen/teichoic acid export membrane protein